ncbi:hypothetical protein MmiEs2_11490 [Methanimicrococcus stummii]|uniref:Prepilin type IV endopeptidase peptidase domain-containing protein n=1 Tax=Methanimicrococcus stummii TaxID=3028294 RepID=A0AA96VIH7_9EURY|nr:prepilin peptidase [Methanimicrococcus sp. Es2]WNY28936.1 hypothetical protein MmiEs2_11490 [Methanimicrococcus sp. Es2]
MNETEILTIAAVFKIILYLTVLFIASIQDLKSRTVSDKLWLTSFLLLIPAILLETSAAGFSHLIDILFSFILFFIFSALCFSTQIFGGADCKAFLLIAIGFPIPIQMILSGGGFNNFVLPFSFIILLNSLLLSLIFIFILFIKTSVSACINRRLKTKKDACNLFKQFLKKRFPFLPAIAGGYFVSISCIESGLLF